MKDFYQVATINNDGRTKTVSQDRFDTEEKAIKYLKEVYDIRWNAYHPEPNGKIVVQKVSVATVYEQHEPSSGKCKCGKYVDKKWRKDEGAILISHEYHHPDRCYKHVSQEIDLTEG